MLVVGDLVLGFALAEVKRQYSGTLGKIGNCQIGVSVHAVGGR